MHKFNTTLLGACLLAGVAFAQTSSQTKPAPKPEVEAPSMATATFAAGCFWCIEPPFDKLKDQGVLSTTSGYAGGTKQNATYEKVSSGTTRHIEAMQVTYDPKKISYSALLEVFWKNVDPFDSKGQFCDRGSQYASAIYAHDAAQKKAIEASIETLNKNPAFAKKGKIQTQVLDFTTFFPAEDYHQDYYTKNPVRYKFYRYSCKRDQRLKEVWGDLTAVF